jgi:hypothetical protein
MIIDDEEGAGSGPGPGQIVPLRPPGGAAQPGLDRGIQGFIGSKLRAMYADLAQQPVPDRFAELLGQLADRNGEDAR